MVRPLDIDQFVDTEVLPILYGTQYGFLLGVCKFCTNLGLNRLFVIITVPIFLKANLIYWVGNGQIGLIYRVCKIHYYK